nr:EsaB/YukD family protein [uncultured Blautia sp.]
MILVDIYIPSLDKNYDFQVDEKVSIKSLILEITDMIENETKSEKNREPEKFMLCSMDQKKILEKYYTLKECDIRNGSKLLLV